MQSDSHPIIPRDSPSGMVLFAVFRLGAFHNPCTSARKQIELSYWRSFTRGAIQLSGKHAHDNSLVNAGTPPLIDLFLERQE